LQGEAQTFSNTCDEPDDPDGPGRLCDVCDSGDLIRELRAPLTVLSTLPTALVGGLLTLVVVWQQASLYAFVGMFMLMGIVKKKRDYDC